MTQASTLKVCEAPAPSTHSPFCEAPRVVPRLPEPIASELSKVLAEKYGLTSAIVVTPPATSDEIAHTVVAMLTARLPSELIDEDELVGLGPGRTIVETCDRIVDVPSCDIVQLTGVGRQAG